MGTPRQKATKVEGFLNVPQKYGFPQLFINNLFCYTYMDSVSCQGLYLSEGYLYRTYSLTLSRRNGDK